MTFLSQLTAAAPGLAVVTDPDALLAYSRDQAPAGLVDAGEPLAAVFPKTTEDVRTIVGVAARHGVPIVTRGAGSGLAGGANAVDGGLVVSLARMNRILDVDPDNMIAVVQPGVVNADLSRAVSDLGLWYPPDPASWEMSTIGGNLATNAGGLCCVKYGVTRDAVLALEVVLADGSVVRPGRRTVKGVAGYDLVGLFVGSEGTLGIITEATLRLRPSAPPATTLVATFPTLPAAGAAISQITQQVVPALLELIDRTTLRAIEVWKRMGLDVHAAALLLAQSDLPGTPGEQEIAAMAAACEKAGATLVVASSDADEAEMLLAARRFAYPALERQGATLLDDVSVPLARTPDLLGGIQEIAGRHDVTIGTFGHAGDGNMHPTILFDPAKPSQVEAARAAFDAILSLALNLGGTLTGEHGIGLLKRGRLADELDQSTLDLHLAVKAALDPQCLLNPGKVL